MVEKVHQTKKMLESTCVIELENTIDFSIAICAYNAEDRLPLVLERLRSQIETENIFWEIIIVDNNSSDRTPKIVQAYQANWPAHCPLIYSFEPKQGLAFARQRAISTARGQWVGFLDDDNLPAANWVAQAHAFAQKHPQSGAFGGQIHADLEVEPPPNFDKIAVFLAIIKRGSQAFIYEPKKRILPPAAGLVVRKQAWRENVPKSLFFKGRVGRSMLASEDLEAIAYIQQAGWEIWYNPEMYIDHKIPRHRLERDYLLSLVRGIGLARHHIRTIRTQFWLKDLLIPFYFLNDLRRVIFYFLKHRQAILTDLATACEMEFLYSSLVSPFYLWKKSGLERCAKIRPWLARKQMSFIGKLRILLLSP